jgi:DNA-binding transcriptional LysR family regulator
MVLRRLRLFLAVVDGGGMTRAAEAERVSQPSVSQAIQELERELGTELFFRVGRRVVLTPSGEALVAPARQALRDVETGRAAVAAVAGLEAGRLDVAALSTLAVDPLAPLVGAFRAAHPGIQVVLADPDDPEALAASIASGACEIGLTVGPTAVAGLRSRPIGRQDLLAVLPPGTTVPALPLPVADFAQFPLVTAPSGSATRNQLEDAFGAAGVTPVIAVVTSQREAILPLVLAGAGATLFPRPLAEQAARLGAAVTALQPHLARPVHVVHRPGPLSPAAEAFIALCW